MKPLELAELLAARPGIRSVRRCANSPPEGPSAARPRVLLSKPRWVRPPRRDVEDTPASTEIAYRPDATRLFLAVFDSPQQSTIT